MIEAPFTSLDALMFDYLAFDAVSVTGTAPGDTSGEQAFFVCSCVVHHWCAQALASPGMSSLLCLCSAHSDAVSVTGTAPGETSGEQALFVCIFIVHHWCAQPA